MPGTNSIQRQYAAADIFIFPTFYDAFGMVITEAMASGLPVITSGMAGAAELIDNGVNGFVVEPAWNVAAITQCLSRLREDPMLGKMGSRAAGWFYLGRPALGCARLPASADRCASSIDRTQLESFAAWRHSDYRELAEHGPRCGQAA
jgi:glycosyltransferase involved in cell wall biosynthesis